MSRFDAQQLFQCSPDPIEKRRAHDKIYREGKKVLMNILDIEVPMIVAVNGPARLHSEYVLLADIVLATSFDGFSG